VAVAPVGLPDSLGALAQFFINDGTLGDTLLRVAELARDMVGPADMTGLTLLVDGRPSTGVFTDPGVPDIDAAQYRTGSGPCMAAFADQRVHRIDSTAGDRRWPEFCQAAAARGVVATLSVPVTARGEGLGALNFYSRAGIFDDGHRGEAELFAQQAAIVLSNAQVYWDARQLGEGLQQAMRSRAVIDQAIGIFLADGGRTPEEAFQLLVRVSQRENLKLRDIAADIVDRAAARPRN
jgi:GAF domain-containing protein